MALRILNRSFSGGEITPELFGRLELSKVQEALALCLNFITLPHGPVVNRPGTEFVEEVKDSASPARLIPFTYNSTQTFAIQLGAGYFRFHSNGATLQVASAAAWSAATAYNPNDIATAGGINYLCIAANTNQNPVASAWASGTAYAVGNLAAYNGITYLCAIAHTSSASNPPPNGSWTALWRPAAWSGSIAYSAGDLAVSGGVTYYCVAASTNQSPAAAAWSGATAYVPGNLASYNGFVFSCVSANTNSAPSYTFAQNANWAALWYALPANGDYEIPNIYAAADLMDIHYTQSADVLTLVHPNYPMLELRRYGATSWELAKINFSPMIAAPVGTVSAGIPVNHQYVVTALIKVSNGSHRNGGRTYTYESMPSPSASCSCDLTQYGAYNTLAWPPVANATSYRVYKYIGGVYQLLGPAPGTTFTDTSSVSANASPWANPPSYMSYSGPASCTATAYPSAIGTLNAIPTGSGSTTYSYVVTALDANSNESYMSSVASCANNLAVSGNVNTINWPSVDAAQRYNVYKSSYGLYGFIGQTASLSFVDNNITPDISRTPPYPHDNTMAGPGDFPATVAYYQQRRFFAGTANQPQNVWATRSGTEIDMSYTVPVRDDSRIAFRIAARDASAIRHIVPLQDMIFFSASCEWKCSSSSGVLTPASVSVQPQSYIGANNVMPVVVGNSILYAAARGGHLRQLGYNWQINGYQTTDSSIFAPHLFDYNNIVDMAYCRGPIPILWCVSSSGKLLGMTWLPEQQIAAWHQHATGNGDVFESVCTISEAPGGGTAGEDMLYCIVRRTINGATRRYVERLHTRLYNTLSDCHYVDCGATYSGAPATSITGLTWLEGMTVNILADGAVLPQQAVSGGTITLPVAASAVHVGLPITAQLQTPPVAAAIDPSMAQGLAKNLNKVYIRTYRSSGIWAGPDFGHLVPYRQRTTESPGAPPSLVSDEIEIVLSNSWGMGGQICIQQSDPLPLDIASMTLEIAVGGGV